MDNFEDVAIERLNIKEFLKRSEVHVLLDVRSPGEFKHAHIPGAISFPLFSDEERKIVGTTYIQQSREQAIKIGLDFFSPKMKSMIEEVEAILSSKQLTGSNHTVNFQSSAINHQPSTSNTVFIYCWRGGMRSAAIAWLLDLYGFKVSTLAGGYKAFRNHVLQTFQRPFSFKILGGFTGSGKTEVLNELKKNGATVIDLEKIASHKGSAFGAFKMPPQPTQEMFENLLANVLERSTTHHPLSTAENPDQSLIWLEDESQRIGNLNIPTSVWESMRMAPIIFLEIPFDERLNHIVEEYGECDREKLIESVQRISQRLGGLATKNAIEFLQQGNIKEAFSILLHYYDKRYLKGLHNREMLPALLIKIPCETVTIKNAALLTKYQPV